MKNTTQVVKALKISDFEDKSLMILDDDEPFRNRLARAMEKKDFRLQRLKVLRKALE